jgi:hypothetical protein
MTLNNDPGSPLKSQKVQAALSQLHGHLTQPEAMERAFIAALQGAIVNEIGRFQVYSDYKKMRPLYLSTIPLIAVSTSISSR